MVMSHRESYRTAFTELGLLTFPVVRDGNSKTHGYIFSYQQNNVHHYHDTRNKYKLKCPSID